MQYLEQRIRQFMSRTGDPQQSHYAPKLSRFENKVSVTRAQAQPLRKQGQCDQLMLCY